MDARVRFGKIVVWEGSYTGDSWVPRYTIKTASDTFREVPHALEWTNLPLYKLYLSILNKIHNLFRPWFTALSEAAHSSNRCVKTCNGMLSGTSNYALIILNELPFCNSRFRTAAPIPTLKVPSSTSTTELSFLNTHFRTLISEFPRMFRIAKCPLSTSTAAIMRYHQIFGQQYSETMEWHILEKGDTGQEG